MPGGARHGPIAVSSMFVKAASEIFFNFPIPSLYNRLGSLEELVRGGR